MNKIISITYNNDMLYVILIFFALILLALLTATVIIAVGIDMRIAVNVDNNFAVVDMFILRSIFLMKVKILLHDGEFYVRIGRGVYRSVGYMMSDKEEKRSKSRPFPRVTLHDVDIRLCVGVENNATLETALVAIFGVLLDNIKVITHNKVRIKNYRHRISPSYHDDIAKVAIDANIKFGIIKLMFYALSGKKIKERIKGEIHEN